MLDRIVHRSSIVARRPSAALGVAIVCGLAGCGGAETPSGDDRSTRPEAPSIQENVPMTLKITSEAFTAGQIIPERYTGDGDDASPPLSWSGVPDECVELALICDDPDAPSPQPWVHWVIYKIPAGTTELPMGVERLQQLGDPSGALQGRNSWGTIGYRGPAPPPGHGVHHYHFKLYALDASLPLGPGLEKSELLQAMQGHVLAEGELVGTYQR